MNSVLLPSLGSSNNAAPRPQARSATRKHHRPSRRQPACCSALRRRLFRKPRPPSGGLALTWWSSPLFFDDELEEDLADGYETASTGSTSVTSSVYDCTFEHGHQYQHFKNGPYPIPNDDEELNREDIKHAMMPKLCNGQLFYAPIGKNPHRQW